MTLHSSHEKYKVADVLPSSQWGASFDLLSWKTELSAIAMKHHAEISKLMMLHKQMLFDAIQKCPAAIDRSTPSPPLVANGIAQYCIMSGRGLESSHNDHHVSALVAEVVAPARSASKESRRSTSKEARRSTSKEARRSTSKEASVTATEVLVEQQHHDVDTQSKSGCLSCGGSGCSMCLKPTEQDVESPSRNLLDPTATTETEGEVEGFNRSSSPDSDKDLGTGSLHKWASSMSRSSSMIHLAGQKRIEKEIFKHESAGYVDQIIGFMIVFNALLLIINSEWKGWQASVKLGIQANDGAWDNAELWFDVLENIFCAFFLGELVSQLYAHGTKYFKSCFNWIDATVVVSNCIDLWILQPLSAFTFGPVTILRLLRIVKLVRTLRIIRAVKIFTGLRVLLKAIVSSLLSLLWSMVLLGMFIMMGGLVMTKLLEEYVFDETQPYQVRLWCWTYYGTSLRAMYTMFEVTLSGCWPNYVRPLLTDVSHLYGILFIMYISFVVFAVIRVITAIFLKETLEAAGNDTSMMIAERTQKRNRYLSKLAAVFKHADESGDGELSLEEFEKIMMDPKVKVYLSALELEVHESTMLFDLLNNGDGTITYEAFIQGVSRLKGQARTLDLVALQMDMKKVLKHLDHLEHLDSAHHSQRHAHAQYVVDPAMPNFTHKRNGVSTEPYLAGSGDIANRHCHDHQTDDTLLRSLFEAQAPDTAMLENLFSHSDDKDLSSSIMVLGS